MQQKTKKKKERKNNPDYKHSLPAGGEIVVLMSD